MSQFKRFNSSDNINWNTNDVYPQGTLTWDSSNGLRIHDGSTSGGNAIGDTVSGPQGPQGDTGPQGPQGPGVYESDTPPSDTNSLWYDTVSGRLYIYYDSSWIDASPGGSGQIGADGPQGPQGPGANQDLDTTSDVEFNSVNIGTGGLLTNGDAHITGNLQVDGVFTFTGTATIISVSSATFFGDTNGFGAFYAGVVGYTPLPVTVMQATANYNDYVQNNFQNLNGGVAASTEWVATANNGNDTNNYIDMGVASSNWDGSQSNSVGTAAGPNDSWVYAQGTTANSVGGNLIVGTIKNGKSVKILTGSTGSSSIVAAFNGRNTAATTTNTGALVVTGGIGVSGNVYAGGTVYSNGYAVSTSTAWNGGTLSGTATVATFIGTATATSTNTGAVQVVGGLGVSGNVYANTVYSADGYFRGPAGYGSIQLASGGALYADSIVLNGAGTIKGPAGYLNITLNSGWPTAVRFTSTATVAGTVNATSSSTGALQVLGGVGVVGNVYAGGNVTANKFVGDGSSLTNVTVNIAGNIVGTGTNVNLVAGSYTYTFDNTGTFTMPNNGDIVMTGINSILSNSGTTLLGGYSQVGGYYSTLGVKYPGGNTQYGMTLQPTADNTNAITFLNAAGTNIGSITQTTSTVKFVGDGSQLTGVGTRTTGSWTVPVGTNTYSITVPTSGAYQIWVRGNIPNGIISYIATVQVTNSNVPVVGTQYAWVYNGGGTPIDFTSIPNQFIGTAGTIVRSSVSPSATTNRFDFGISNSSTSSQIVYWGYVTL